MRFVACFQVDIWADAQLSSGRAVLEGSLLQMLLPGSLSMWHSPGLLQQAALLFHHTCCAVGQHVVFLFSLSLEEISSELLCWKKRVKLNLVLWSLL